MLPVSLWSGQWFKMTHWKKKNFPSLLPENRLVVERTCSARKREKEKIFYRREEWERVIPSIQVRKPRADVAKEKQRWPSKRVRELMCAVKAAFIFLFFEEDQLHLSCPACNYLARPRHDQPRTGRVSGLRYVPVPAPALGPASRRCFTLCGEPAEGETAILGLGKIWPLQNPHQFLGEPHTLLWASATHPDFRCTPAQSGWSR